MNRSSLLIFLILFTISLTGFSQYFHYTGNALNGTANPLLLNPGFAGAKNAPRLSAGIGIGQDISSENLSLSFDQYVKTLKGGVSVRLNSASWHGQTAGTGLNAISIAYCPKFTTQNMFTIAPALELGIANQDYSFVKSTNHLSGRVGILINSKNSYLGAYTSVLSNSPQHWDKTSIQLGHVLTVKETLKLSIDGQYVREYVNPPFFGDVWASKDTTVHASFFAQSILTSVGIKYRKLKLTTGGGYNVGRGTNLIGNNVSFKSSITPIIGLGYFGQRFTIQGIVILNQRYRSVGVTSQWPKSYQTDIKVEVAATYTFKGNNDKKSVQ